MLLTEEQAREKWCPEARVPSRCFDSGGQYEVAANRGVAKDKPYEQARCIASDCMMWRWEKYYESTPQGCKFVTAEKGYCGLSGEIPK